MKPRRLNRRGEIDAGIIVPIVAVVVILMVMFVAFEGFSQEFAGLHPHPAIPPTGNSGVDEASYIIYKDGIWTCAKNGTTGAIDYSSTNSSRVIQEALDSVASNSSHMFSKIILKGDFTISYRIAVHNYTDLEINGRLIRGASCHSWMLFCNWVHNVTISGGLLDGMSASDGSTTHGILVNNARNVVVRDMVILNTTGYSVYVHDSSFVDIVGNHVLNSQLQALTLEAENANCYNNRFTSNIVEYSPTGIYLESIIPPYLIYNTIISDNMVSYINGTGIGQMGPQNSIINDNSISYCDADGVAIISSDNNTISGNSIFHNGYGASPSYGNGIRLDDGGVHAWKSTNNSITSNVIRENRDNAICQMGGTDYNIIVGNDLTGNGAAWSYGLPNLNGNNTIADNKDGSGGVAGATEQWGLWRIPSGYNVSQIAHGGVGGVPSLVLITPTNITGNYTFYVYKVDASYLWVNTTINVWGDQWYYWYVRL